MQDFQIIVPGGLNTDIVGLGVERILGPGELTLGGELKIGPGGKARNMAQMAATYLGKGQVAMIGRSSRDPFGLWEVPVTSLKKAGVDISFVKISEFSENGNKFPGIALIPVAKSGRNQIYVLPGINLDFNPEDIEEASILFRNPGRKKVMILALEIPLATAKSAIRKAQENHIRIILDPGGIDKPIDDLLNGNIFLIKPNEHEAEIITGIRIKDFESARRAAQKMLSKGVQNVFITHGDKGGYLFNNQINLMIQIPQIGKSRIHDETGCGDQVTAILAACLSEGRSLTESAEISIVAGTLQFYRAGIQPISRTDLSKYIETSQT